MDENTIALLLQALIVGKIVDNRAAAIHVLWQSPTRTHHRF
jgi:hypothetical protein